MTVRLVINRLQTINEQVSNMVYAPQLEDYPEGGDTMALPIALTHIENGQFQGGNADNQSEDTYVIRVLFEALGASALGPKLDFGAEIYDAYRVTYLDEDTYKLQQPDGTWAAAGLPVLLDSPYRATIRMPFRTTGLTVLEYPVNSDFWWHGFEIRFTVTEDWEWACD